MNSKERFKLTVNHEFPGKVVVDFGSTAVTGIHVKTVENIRNYLGLPNRPVRVIEPFQMLGELDSELIELLGIDVVGAWGKKNLFGFNNHPPLKEFKTFWGQIVLVPENFNTTCDQQGDLVIYPEGDMTVPPSARMPQSGYFFDAIIRQQSINEDMLDVRDNLEEFGLLSEDELIYWEQETDRASRAGKAVIAGFGGTALGDIALVPGMQLKNPKGIRDVAEWYMSTLIRPDYVKSVFERQTEIAIENLKQLNQRVGHKVDAVFICGTDFGTQNSTFCAPEQFDDMWMPYYQSINKWIHENTSWKTFKHSCGAVEPFMDHFIKAGFDIINPVQINAEGMDPAHLKNKYGDRLIFWGGGVDTQKLLPFGKPEQIREQVLRTCDIFSKKGGFVFNTVHNIQANVPVENVMAVFEALREFNS